ncbi:MAG: hypothetical protein OQJ93_01955 [Ignavibacteriaceae bacterium]|nr:hypothetical protein [Ignavibacteriaceae bacterium]MCW8813487.1 hypothetical protein [Chlorobium sp.]MCW8994584.1 hypothetical protein [Psychromonas sp.]MCW8823783.1 hypothetical protein [Ignavibacteriaceae bacterium]MCW8960056.1 hypothetical protein [Ignavibacteriaceae bacterium]
MSKENEQKKSKQVSGCTILFFVIVGSIVLIAILSTVIDSNDSNSPDNFNTPRNAFYISKQFVEDKLKAPSTAEFPYYNDRNVSVIKVNGTTNQYIVKGYVDSQNSFGAMIRTRYICTVRHKYDSTWELVDLQFLE